MEHCLPHARLRGPPSPQMSSAYWFCSPYTSFMCSFTERLSCYYTCQALGLDSYGFSASPVLLNRPVSPFGCSTVASEKPCTCPRLPQTVHSTTSGQLPQYLFKPSPPSLRGVFLHIMLENSEVSKSQDPDWVQSRESRRSCSLWGPTLHAWQHLAKRLKDLLILITIIITIYTQAPPWPRAPQLGIQSTSHWKHLGRKASVLRIYRALLSHKQ